MKKNYNAPCRAIQRWKLCGVMCTSVFLLRNRACKRIAGILFGIFVLIVILLVPGCSSTANVTDAEYHIVADFDAIQPVSTVAINADSTSTSISQAEGVSPYGNAVCWEKSDKSCRDSEVTFLIHEVGNPDCTALVFWVSFAKSDGTPLIHVKLSDGAGWYLEKGKAFWTISDDGTCTQKIINYDQYFQVKLGFAGWVIIPLDSFYYRKGRDNDPNLYPERITGIRLIYETQTVSGPIYLDQFGFTTDVISFMKRYGNWVDKAENAISVADFDSGTVGNTAGEDVVAWTNAADTTLMIDGDIGNNLYSLQMQLRGKSEVHIPLDKKETAVLSPYKGLALWVTAGEVPVTLTPSLVTESGTLSLEFTDARRDFYRLTCADTGETTAYILRDNSITVPAHFSGFLILDTVSFQTGKAGIDLSTATELVLTTECTGVLWVDSVQAVISMSTFITDDIHCMRDDDVLFAVAEGWRVENSVIHLPTKAVTSTQFREALAVRYGYRMVFLDGNRYQVFGALGSMENIEFVDVYLSGTRIATYELHTDSLMI